MAVQYENLGADATNSDGTTLTGGSSGAVWGSWVELSASTARKNYWALASIVVDSDDTTFGIQIGTGAASSETPLVTLHAQGNGQASSGTPIYFPLTIDATTRVSARVQSTTAFATLQFSLNLNDDSRWGEATAYETIGFTSAQGTQIDPGGSANTKGSWTQLSAGTSHDYDYMLVMLSGNDNGAMGADVRGLLDIGTGAASSETVQLGNLGYRFGNTEEYGHLYGSHADIASGTRIAARAQANTTDATDRLLDVSVLGIQMTAPGGGGGATSIFGHGG